MNSTNFTAQCLLYNTPPSLPPFLLPPPCHDQYIIPYRRILSWRRLGCRSCRHLGRVVYWLSYRVQHRCGGCRCLRARVDEMVRSDEGRDGLVFTGHSLRPYSITDVFVRRFHDTRISLDETWARRGRDGSVESDGQTCQTENTRQQDGDTARRA